MSDLDRIVYPFASTEVKTALGESDHAKYLYRYLNEIKAATCIIESQYIDKDYTINYQKFYCRQFKEPKRNAARLHFFSNEFDNENFLKRLVESKKKKELVADFNNNYLGFVVVRPIPNWKKQPLIGRTLLKKYPKEESDKKRCFISIGYDLSLFGIPLRIESLPFQAKDKGVSACATIALWAALHPLADLFDLPRHSPAEITEMATSRSSSHRSFPNEGLTQEQILNYIKLLGLDMEVIRPKNNEVIQTAIRAFIYAGFPILASLTLKKLSTKAGSEDDSKVVKAQDEGQPEVVELEDSSESDVNSYKDRHAVVISGYQKGSDGSIHELYVHDDNVGPYCRVLPNPDFFSWKYQFQDWDYALYTVKLEDLRIPVYPKVRTAFWRIFKEYDVKKDEIKTKLNEEVRSMVERTRRLNGDKKEEIVKGLISSYRIELLLSSNRKYKDSLLEQNIIDKEKILTKLLPRYFWVVRLYHNSDPINDILYDSTSVYAEQLESVKYVSMGSIILYK